MKDIEFVSSLLIFLRSGMESEINQKAINKMYDLYNEEYAEKDSDYNITSEILDEIQNLIDKYPNVLKSISKTTHLYTLFTLMYISVSNHQHLSDKQMQKINQFYELYEQGDDNQWIEDYRTYSKDATSSKPSRSGRLKALRSFLEV